VNKTILMEDRQQPGYAGLVLAGPFLFTAGCDGHRDRQLGEIRPELAGAAELQCENAYGRIQDLLAVAGVGMDAVVRLDHTTSSQDWLARRQTIRQKYFGRPAPLASTGIAARMEGINMLTASAIAVADARDKAVLVSGPKYGMNNISSAVRGGPFLFMSGLRGHVDPRTGETVEEETPGAFEAQTRLCLDLLRAILRDAGADASHVLRVDNYIRERKNAAIADAIVEECLGKGPHAMTTVALPLGARGEVELTALAAFGTPEIRRIGPGIVNACGFHLIGQTNAPKVGQGDVSSELKGALDALEGKLTQAGSTLSNIVRLEIYLDDIYSARSVLELLRPRLGPNPPVTCVAGADLGRSQVMLAAIAV
jgi:enamine deaminase RidA (YjgF/YER057c/UK114 family)